MHYLSREKQERIADIVWKESGNNTLRIWMTLKHYAPNPGERNLDAVFSRDLVQYIHDAQKRGLKQIVLGPCGMPSYLCDTTEVE